MLNASHDATMRCHCVRDSNYSVSYRSATLRGHIVLIPCLPQPFSRPSGALVGYGTQPRLVAANILYTPEDHTTPHHLFTPIHLYGVARRGSAKRKKKPHGAWLAHAIPPFAVKQHTRHTEHDIIHSKNQEPRKKSNESESLYSNFGSPFSMRIRPARSQCGC